MIAVADKKRDIAQAFDEACDAAAAGEAELTKQILSRAFPKWQAQHVLENILAACYKPKPETTIA